MYMYGVYRNYIIYYDLIGQKDCVLHVGERSTAAA